MDRAVCRYLTGAAAATAFAGLVAVLPAVTPSLPDVAVPAAELTANAADLQDTQTLALYQHIQQEFAGNSDPLQQSTGVDEVLADGGSGSATLDVSDLSLDERAVNDLAGGTFDPTGGQEAPIIEINPSAPGFFGGGNATSGLFGTNDPGTEAAANSVAISAADFLPALQATHQAFTSGVLAAELAYNDALVNMQLDSVTRGFGADSTAGSFVSWVLSVNNATLAESENTLNALLGVNFDPQDIHNSLVAPLNADGLTMADWASLLGVSPDELTHIVAAAESSSPFDILGGLGLF